MLCVDPQRIGVLSLQRLGDVVTARRVTEALSMRQSTDRVEVIHFDVSQQAAELLPGVDACHALSLSGLRELKACNPVSALAGLRGRLDEICDGGFDRIINLSSTRFACLLAPTLVHAGGSVDGPWIDDSGQYRSNHPAITYLDDWGVESELNVFSHADLYTLGARVRLGTYRGLGSPEGNLKAPDRPIAVQIHASQSSKQWRDREDPQGWAALIALLQRRFGCPVVLIGAPSEAPALARLATVTGAHLGLEPLRPTVELLQNCRGLISVDTVAIHLAASVGCPCIVLRDGEAGGFAFVPGPRALLVDSAREATASDICSLAARYFFDQSLPTAQAQDYGDRLRVRESSLDSCGHVSLRCPQWLPVSFDVRDADEMDDAWRLAWRNSFDEIPIPQRVLEALERPQRPVDVERLRRALGSPMPLGRTLQNRTVSSGRAA